ncbi:TolC family protein [Prevotella pallens]|jgi:outer membrane efflux protein|uniref:Outer membrane protein TolC n=2 Tax=Prevotella pallens TaxID=60133 RepID=A0ABX9DU98_9BACT|nr:TolC family protein [Prevotella pallens]EGQ13974.1 putative alkaline protease aprF [Prevotella pallens ATCC 700821]MBF1451650.1 TolC family protein [Prevotella pallens]MBF1464179.1 TolC family protein [Prevotella pallens]MBF1466575.1 TolC family protein [Prevotella pallens]MBF1502682.1 TolC family protein [Prevotella pallens]
MIKRTLLFSIFLGAVNFVFSQEMASIIQEKPLRRLEIQPSIAQKTIGEKHKVQTSMALENTATTQETAADKMENGTAESQEVIAERRNVLSLKRCRELALANNKQLAISKLTAQIAEDTHKAAKTKYLPRVTGMAGYEHLSREISLLNDKQKQTLSSLGSTTVGQVGSQIGQTIGQLQQQGFISAQVAQRLADVLGGITTPLSQAGNNIGETIRRGLRTNTKNMYAAGIMVTQPIYMGGGIKALNDIATIGEEFAQNDIKLKQQTVLFAVDNAYWLIVSLQKKSILAIQYRNLISKLHDNVTKMYDAGVATKADGLKVSVAENTANLTISEIENGISLAKMALCQLCGLPLDGDLILEDEATDNLSGFVPTHYNNVDTTFNARPEVRILQNTVDITKQNTKIIQALYRPHLALTAGYTVSNPNAFNGFEQKFKDIWSVGLVLHVPIWNWGEGKYKVRAARTATQMAQMELNDVRNKIRLEVEQTRFRLKNANSRLATANKNMASAEENLRVANLGFKEGVMTVTDVMQAQTAWMSAKTAIVDAEIDVRTAQVALKKALGEL